VKPEMYFSVDIESSGPVPGKYSMLSFGACVVGMSNQTYYAELKPISEFFVPEAMKVSGFSLDRLRHEGIAPDFAMTNFREWVIKTTGDHRPVFVGFNACYDWQFINWYFNAFAKDNPFGFGGVDIKSYYMGLSGVRWSKTTSSQLPEMYLPDVPQTHNALDDAIAQASIFQKMLASR
jgi:ribonuclease T